jgi:MoxR-like ATPase
MNLLESIRSGIPVERDTLIGLMRAFSRTCLAEAATAVGLTPDEARRLIDRGNLDGPGRYRQSNYKSVGGLTPFFKQFKPTSVIFERAMLGTAETGGNDWLTGIRINTERAEADQYRVTGVYAGLIRWGFAGMEIEEQMVRAAEAAWASAGSTLSPLDRDAVGEHMWGMGWMPSQLAAMTETDLSRTIAGLITALIAPLRERREWHATAPGAVLFPRFEAVTIKTPEAIGAPPTDGAYQFNFRMHESRSLAPAGRQLEAVVLGRPVTFRLGRAASGVRYSTSCEGSYPSIREVGLALGMQHGDHARLSLQSDGRWLVEQEGAPAVLVKLGNVQARGRQLDGPATMAALETYLGEHPSVRFGVRAPDSVRASRLLEYRAAMQRDLPVSVYLSAGTSAGGTGDIAYVAHLAGIETSQVEIEAPGDNVAPELTGIGGCRTWLQLRDLQRLALPLSDFILEESGKPVERGARGPMMYVYRAGTGGSVSLAQVPMELVGSSREIDQYFEEMRDFIEQHGACLYFWTFGIRRGSRERLDSGPFWLNIYKAGSDQMITHRCRVEKIYTSDDTGGMESPEPAYTLEPERGQRVVAGSLARTWLKITAFEELLEPVPLTDFVDYDSGDSIVPQALISAFAYVRRGKAANVEPPPERERTLAEILELFRASAELVYAPDDLINLHHSLYALPHKHFVILHGVSGTGKSQFAQAYANALYDRRLTETGNPYYRIVSVQPTWQDRTALLGYYNPLTEVYEVPPFLGHVLMATQDPNHKYIICLDEMNLAVVEHYFADFLSAWESREPIPLHHHAGKVANIPEAITVPDNLLIIGTVNVDETTHGFSPKVLDRAYTVELTYVDVRGFGERFLRQPGAADFQPILSRAVALLDEANRILEPQGLHFAYRTVSEILHYLLANARSVPQLEEGAALDLMLCQKVLPKLRGDDRMLTMLQDLERLLRQHLGVGSFRAPAVLARLVDDARRFGTFQYWR